MHNKIGYKKKGPDSSENEDLSDSDESVQNGDVESGEAVENGDSSDSVESVQNGDSSESEGSSEAESIIDLTNGWSSRDLTIVSNTDQSILDSTLSTVYGEHDSTWSPGDDTLNSSATSNYSVMLEAHAFVVGYNEPLSYENALESIERDEWIKAMDDEYKSLCENHTWDLVTLPQGRKVIDNKWVYKIKHKPSGQIERFKARLVIRGFTQKFGVDYGETFIVQLLSFPRFAWFWPSQLPNPKKLH